jgi:UDP-N-acetylmuramate: L-alanyl-gamma-D-glutamyl-meso-diaminopimelate ligase
MSDVLNQEFAHIYLGNIDKQRIVICGHHAHTIFEMVRHVLNHYQKKADYLIDDQLINTGTLNFTDATLLIVRHPKPIREINQLNAHVLILSQLSDNSELSIANALADALPKSGILIADEREPVAQIAKKERVDVLTISYKVYNHIVNNQDIILITSTNEKVTVKVKGEEPLRCVGAAKETLKRIGISSGQFYRAIATFEP